MWICHHNHHQHHYHHPHHHHRTVLQVVTVNEIASDINWRQIRDLAGNCSHCQTPSSSSTLSARPPKDIIFLGWWGAKIGQLDFWFPGFSVLCRYTSVPAFHYGRTREFGPAEANLLFWLQLVKWHCEMVQIHTVLAKRRGPELSKYYGAF